MSGAPVTEASCRGVFPSSAAEALGGAWPRWSLKRFPPVLFRPLRGALSFGGPIGRNHETWPPRAPITGCQPWCDTDRAFGVAGGLKSRPSPTQWPLESGWWFKPMGVAAKRGRTLAWSLLLPDQTDSTEMRPGVLRPSQYRRPAITARLLRWQARYYWRSLLYGLRTMASAAAERFARPSVLPSASAQRHQRQADRARHLHLRLGSSSEGPTKSPNPHAANRRDLPRMAWA